VKRAEGLIALHLAAWGTTSGCMGSVTSRPPRRGPERASCVAADWVLGRWVFVPVFVDAFYGGMIVIDLLTYPMFSL
jgi:hypothetical protein